MKICNKDCKYCQPFNDAWIVCWNKTIKGSKVQLGKNCPVELIKASKEAAR